METKVISCGAALFNPPADISRRRKKPADVPSAGRYANHDRLAVGRIESPPNRSRFVPQAEKLLPQPQVFTAFGFSNVKPRFSSPS